MSMGHYDRCYEADEDRRREEHTTQVKRELKRGRVLIPEAAKRAWDAMQRRDTIDPADARRLFFFLQNPETPTTN